MEGAAPSAQPEEESFFVGEGQVAVDGGQHGLLVLGEGALDLLEEVDVVC